MRILRQYLATDFVVTCLVSLLVVTFVLSVGYVFQIIDVIVRGVPWKPVFMILAASIPTSLRVSVPMGALVACLLLFGRLSADGEIVAMKACGVKLRQASRTMILVTLLFVSICLYVNHYIEPLGHYVRRSTLSELATVSAVALLEEGRFHSFEGFTLYIGKRRGEDLERIRIYDFRDPTFKREIYARRGRLQTSENASELILDLEDVRIDPFAPDNPAPGHTGRLRMTIDNVRWKTRYQRDEEDLVLHELIAHLIASRDSLDYQIVPGRPMVREHLYYEISKRTSFAFAPLALVLVGIPLGIRSHRKESSIGIAISLGLVLIFYLLMLLAESTQSRPEWRPDIIIWMPTVLFLVAGLLMLRRAH